jgi:hypothetical protein
MDQTVVARSGPVASHHLDHPELLLLDNAVVRLAEHYIAKQTLTASQRGALCEYRTDLDALLKELEGPAREYAEQVVALAQTVLDGEADLPTVAGADAPRSAHRAA